MLTFTSLAEHHTYTLQCDNGIISYTLFKDISFDQLQNLQSDGSTASADNPPGDAPSSAPS
jgi:hypothetical protein